MQAARGASLTSSDAGPSGPEASARRAARTIVVLVALTAYVVDVASKAWAVDRLARGDIEVLGDWFVGWLGGGRLLQGVVGSVA